jgi:hypothetical protein
MPMISDLELFTPKLSMNGLFSQFIYYKIEILILQFMTGNNKLGGSV